MPDANTRARLRSAGPSFWASSISADCTLNSSGVQEVEVDKQGRIAIVAPLRSFATLHDAVLVNGALNRIELWNPERWEEKVAATEAALIEDD